MSEVERLKPRDTRTVAETVAHARTGAVPESEQYLAARKDALEAAGIELRPEDAPASIDDDESTEAHLKRLRGR